MNCLSFSLYCIFLSGFVVASPVYAKRGCDFPAIYSFGGGTPDTGGFSALFASSPTFYGQTYFHGPSGRASDGRILIDFMAESLGKSFLSHYLDSLGANFSQGANFAQLLSTIRVPRLIVPRDTLPNAFNPVYLGLQYAEFVQFADRSQKVRKQGGIFKSLMPKNESFRKGLYTFDIAQNDLAQELFNNPSIDEIKKTLPDIVNNFTAVLKNLYNVVGARTFWIHNTGPIGCYPYLLTIVPTKDVDSVGCSKPANEVAQTFNSILKSAVEQLRIDLPLAAITYVDTYSAYYSLYLEPQRYGFELPLVACCGLGGAYNYDPVSGQCGVTATVNGSEVTPGPCKNPSKRINWDGIAYTEAANKIIFDKIATGKYSDPPNSLRFACRR